MALFNRFFPYTNLHDINLDWIISIIKSIDPAVIQALQQLTPNIIEQVTQKVNEAQAAAIAAQSSASEANTAKENAATSAAEAAQDATEAVANAALANADAVRAENAANVVTDALAVKSFGVTASAHATVGDAQILQSGKTITFYLSGTLNGKAAGARTEVGTVTNFPTLTSSRRFCGWFWRGGAPTAVGTAEIGPDGILSVNNANFEVGDALFIDTAFMI